MACRWQHWRGLPLPQAKGPASQVRSLLLLGGSCPPAGHGWMQGPCDWHLLRRTVLLLLHSQCTVNFEHSLWLLTRYSSVCSASRAASALCRWECKLRRPALTKWYTSLVGDSVEVAS